MAAALALAEPYISTVATNQPREITTPQQHYDLLHGAAHGTVILWERLSNGRQWHKLRPGSAEIPQILSGHAGDDDCYMTVNQFYGWRTIDKLQSLRAMYLDIDGCTDLDLVLEALRDAALPPPSVAVFSGRGIHLYWIHEPTIARALPVWQRCQDRLINLMKHLGADPAARDCPRVLRLVGSVNIKNGETARGLVLHEKKWNFHDLCDAILGYRPERVQPSERDTHKPKAATVRDLTTGRANRGQRPRNGSIYDRWYLVYQDLRAIAGHYGKAGIPEGHRHTWLLLTAVSLSWFAHADTISDELTRQAKIWTPGQTDTEILSALKEPLKRAVEASKGLTREYQDEQVDARFRYKRKTMYGLLQKIIPLELAPKLRAIVSDDTKAEHERERELARAPRDRVAEGRHKSRHEDSLSALAPWDALGISRATYYRQRAAGTLATYPARARG